MTIQQIQKSLSSASLQAVEGTLRYLAKKWPCPAEIRQDVVQISKRFNYPWSEAHVRVVISTPCKEFEPLYLFLLQEGQLCDQDSALRYLEMWANWKGKEDSELYDSILEEFIQSDNPLLSFLACLMRTRIFSTHKDVWTKAALVIQHDPDIRSIATELMKKNELQEINIELESLGVKPLIRWGRP